MTDSYYRRKRHPECSQCEYCGFKINYVPVECYEGMSDYEPRPLMGETKRKCHFFKEAKP